MNWKKLLIILAILFSSLLAFLAYTGSISYFYAIYLEGKWDKVNPKTKNELENIINLYTKRQISPEESLWGWVHKLQKGERMIQYMILYDAPLDVVYDENDRIVHIYTSYE